MFKNSFIGLLLLLSNFVNAQSSGIAYELDTLFKGFHQRERISGAMLVARNDTILYQNALGYADGSNQIPLTIHGSFNLASVSKQFTTMCVMLLKERGKLQFDDKAQKYLPALPYDNITIRQLMTHTAGVPEYFDWYEKRISKR